MTSPVGLWMDWSGAGFGSTAYDDCTPYLVSFRHRRGGASEITGSSGAGGGTIRLRNPGGLFDPDNSSGPLYGLLRDGVRVWLGANEDGSIAGDGTVRGRAAGRVLDISPLPEPGAGDSTPLVEITFEDAKGWYARTPVSLSVGASTPDFIPPLPPLPGTVLLDYGASGWKYQVGAHGLDPGFEAPGYDDSGWSSGTAAFGSSGMCSYVFATSWATNTDIVLRHHITVPLGVAWLVISYGIDNNALVYLDGALVQSVAHDSCASRTDQSATVSAPAAGDRVIAVRGTDTGVATYFDMKITVGP